MNNFLNSLGCWALLLSCEYPCHWKWQEFWDSLQDQRKEFYYDLDEIPFT